MAQTERTRRRPPRRAESARIEKVRRSVLPQTS